MPSDFQTLTRVCWVTPNYVGISGGHGDSLELVHRSQVVGNPKIGDWVTATGRGHDMHLRVVEAVEKPAVVLQYSVAG